MKKSIPISLLLVSFLGFAFAKGSGSKYLHKPDGSFGVGYKQQQLINTLACPSLFFNETNKDSFSATNPSHCNEIELVVYYPTKKYGNSPYSPITSLIADAKSFNTKLSMSDIKQIKSIRSFSATNLPIAPGRFPVIFFSPGFGVSTQLYENIITELVSQGYIVIGINSQFLSGEMKFNKAKTSKVIDSTKEEVRKNFFRANYMDLEYVYQLLKQKKLANSIVDKINWDRVVMLGHSLGSAAVARFSDKKGIKAIVGLDLTIDLLYGNDCHEKATVPFLHIFSSNLYQKNKTHEFPYLCKANQSLPFKQIAIIGKPDSPTFSMHMNFCDYSTLQYAPPIRDAIKELEKKPDEVFLGTGDGWDITQSINQEIVAFFAKYI